MHLSKIYQFTLTSNIKSCLILKTQFASVFSIDQGDISTIHTKSAKNSINKIDFNGECIVKL